ncbi:hypothetical protein TNCV_4527611 [Trichonephila clavipes]|nr:hypothetical protein TNCV_4527611 [Trichonephila clavipes]
MIRGPQTTEAQTSAITVPLIGLQYLRKGPEGILIQGPLGSSCASGAKVSSVPLGIQPIYLVLLYSTVKSRLTRTRSYAIFKSRRFVPPIIKTVVVVSVPEPDEIGNMIEDVVDLARQINLEVDSDDVQKVLDTHNQELTMDELVQMHE